MQLFAFGINHHTAPLGVRELVTFPENTMEHALHDLVGRNPIKEAAIVSTCNRTEVYCSTDKPEIAMHWLADFHHMPVHELDPYLYKLSREQAVKHAFRVASGLDSMVLGEPQILGQLKNAVKSAEHAGTLGLLLHKLFQRTFFVAKEVRTSTEIGTNSISMAAAAARLAERIFGDIGEQRVLFIGAGEMIELCASHFAARHPKCITVANRTAERAELLSNRFNARAITLGDLPEELALHDIVVTCTASPLPILGKGMVERAIKIRKHRPIFIVDLAVPRDVELEVAELDDVFLYYVDDLADIVKEGLDSRQSAVAQAETIIDSNVVNFMRWMASRELVPTIRALRDQAERYRRHELARAGKLLAQGKDPQEVIESLSNGLTNKFLHAPSSALNHAPAEERDDLVELVNRLYQLHRPQ
ncbi:glutamyl-tRNA reductase [Nitrosomonas cryotolerans]|uniref:Glutamyl-tRNA reductase n=1 Tax=Nitrosomonas cryotolerans ATCC 49181 TaxID=1131553 RepID=A0A1N6IXY9_9PROT|nr:glutamyl-tRNA reductase [Nitrosomonas cryotolerans]SFQ01551.1 glutamyl-tRNA reductase [Nitrosomonas cryotolerans]SIO36871.1 glutamyl-tRNA reductase [Nitrosomonas cryotolerans ATCC 49181]